jgi:ABC-type transporter Mla MlaB component
VAGQRLPGPGLRRWGVRLSRAGHALTLAPTGRLDGTSVTRLADVALTRMGTFDRLLIDLRDLAEIDVAGVRDLAGWPQLVGFGDVELRVVTDNDSRIRIGAAGVALLAPMVENV